MFQPCGVVGRVWTSSALQMNGEPRTSRSSGANEVLRSKNKKRDDQIRMKVEKELARRTSRKSSLPVARSSVSSLKPNPAVLIIENAKVIQACQLMAAKRTDALLVVSDVGDLVGILTDKDIAFRVVAEQLDVRTTVISDVMTRDPLAVFDKGSRNEALNIMISRKFRHLPVISEGSGEDQDGTNVVGLLDITKCVFERLDDLEKRVNEDQNIISAMETLERRGTVDSDRLETLRSTHECPDVGAVLEKINHSAGAFPGISVKSNVRDAAKVMKNFHGTAVLVLGTPDGEDKVAGIFTTKDIVLRVIAASLDPNTTSVIRVMTPHPDFVCSDTPILEALKKLHDGHFLHLPVIDAARPVGLVDVMTLTVTMLTYLMSKTTGVADPTQVEGPMWNTFWNSAFAASTLESSMDPDNVSVVSDRTGGLSSSLYNTSRPSLSRRSEGPASPRLPHHPRDSRMFSPELSGAMTPDQDTRSSYREGIFSFKLKDMTVGGAGGKVYRFSSSPDSIAELYAQVKSKTGYTSLFNAETPEPDHLDFRTPSGVIARLSYIDDEGDIVALENDKDVSEAVEMCRLMKLGRLMVYLGNPPSPAATPYPSSHLMPHTLSEAHASPVPSRPGSPFVRPRSALPADTRSNIQQPAFFEVIADAPLPVQMAMTAGVGVVSFFLFKLINRL